MNKIDLLTQMKNYGGAWQRQGRVQAIVDQLRECLLENEYYEVVTAWGHYKTGEGADELYAVCNRLINKYREGPPPRKSLICA